MSGVEVVGLVLGAIPLVISALEHYKQGMNGVKRFRNHLSSLKMLNVRLKCVKIEYRQTIQGIFARQAIAVNEEGFFERPGIEIQMRDRLGQDFDSFMIIVEEMDCIMKEFMGMLQIGTDGKPNWTHSNDRIKWEWTRIRESFNPKERLHQLRELGVYNKNLRILLQAKDISAPYTQSERQASVMVQYFDLIQNQSGALRTVVSDSLKCACNPCHDAYLRLQHPDGPLLTPILCLTFPGTPRSASHTAFWDLKNVKACISSCCGQSIRESMAPTSISSTSSKSSFDFCHGLPAQRPISLCHTLQTLGNSAMPVGHFADGSGSQFACIAADEPVMTLSRAICLDSLLTGDGPLLTQTQRLHIAVKLASAVLQLYNSPWLEHDFNSRDVHFFFGDPNHELAHSVDGPFLRRSFQKPPNTLTSPDLMALDENEDISSASLVPNRTLYHLAILLIELCLNKRFNAILNVDSIASGTQGPGAATRDFGIAQQQIETVYGEFGNTYGDVVKRCLKCEFNIDQRLRRFDVVQFRQQVYEGVVAPLEQCSMYYDRYRGDLRIP